MDFINLIKSDLFRYHGTNSFKLFASSLWTNPGFKYTFFIRLAGFLRSRGWVSKIAFVFVRVIIEHLQYKYGISIPYNTTIGCGFYIGHFGGIVINHDVIIGNNCNINHGVTIGATYGGKTPGTPILKNNVFVGPGAKIIGGISIGNNVAIGANCVVTSSIPDNAVVVGVPGKVISHKGSANYVVNTV